MHCLPHNAVVLKYANSGLGNHKQYYTGLSFCGECTAMNDHGNHIGEKGWGAGGAMIDH